VLCPKLEHTINIVPIKKPSKAAPVKKSVRFSETTDKPTLSEQLPQGAVDQKKVVELLTPLCNKCTTFASEVKATVMESINAILNGASSPTTTTESAVPASKRVIIYFSGNTNMDGDWALYDGFISLAELVAMWEKCSLNSKGGILVLVADCSYSGKWVHKAKEMKLHNVIVQAACGTDEQAFFIEGEGSAFTTALIALNLHHGTEPTLKKVYNQHPMLCAQHEAFEGVGRIPISDSFALFNDFCWGK